MKPGDKVRYMGNHHRFPNGEPGIIKSVQSTPSGDWLYVVYNCGGDWDNYQNYTGARTHHSQLKPGWDEKQD